jgi:hypothetical protein
MNGSLGINFLIPERVEKVQVYEGAACAQNGDVPSAGAAS